MGGEGGTEGSEGGYINFKAGYIALWSMYCIAGKFHRVQFSLEAVSNLTTVSTSSIIQLSWQPPFSLNLTTAEPDIVYCIDALNITNHQEAEFEADNLVSNCSVFETYYQFVIVNLYTEDLFQFVVTPRSNVEGARNETPSVINVSYSFESKF